MEVLNDSDIRKLNMHPLTPAIALNLSTIANFHNKIGSGDLW